jgi:hypothetical protein
MYIQYLFCRFYDKESSEETEKTAILNSTDDDDFFTKMMYAPENIFCNVLIGLVTTTSKYFL